MSVLTFQEKATDLYTDEELVHLFIHTQHNTYFEEIYQRYADKVYRKCLSFTKDPARAEDFTHDIFLKLILKLGTFKESARFSTWLYSITYNYCMDQLRIYKKRSEVYADEELEIPDDTNLDVAFEEQDVEAKRLTNALDHLQTEEKSILLMKYQDGLSIREIAGVFRITESAAKMRLLRSREKLRTRYLETIVFWGLLFAKLLELLKYTK